MATKKNIATAVVNEYIPPRLVKAAQGWYIVFYHNRDGVWVRERKTFNLNRIREKRKRMERARDIIDELEEGLKEKRPMFQAEKVNALAGTNIIEAIKFVSDLKCASFRKETVKSFRMIEKMLIDHITKKKLSDMAIGQWSVKHSQAFLDEALRRGIGNTTYNNYRRYGVAFWNTLIKRDYISENPWQKIEKREEEEKRRRPFNNEEREIVLKEIYERDWWLFILVMLHFLTLIRRTECYRLRFSNFNLKEGYIRLPKNTTKNKRDSLVTIPEEMMQFLLDPRFSKYPENYLLFGPGRQPHPTKQAGEQTYKELHRKILKQLQEEGKIGDITGLSLYSWKDTGMTVLARILKPVELRDHARHASIDQSLGYYHGDKIIEAVKKANVVGKKK